LRKHVRETHPDATTPGPSATRIPCPFAKTDDGCTFHARRPALLDVHLETVHAHGSNGNENEIGQVEEEWAAAAGNGATGLRDRLTGWAYEQDESRKLVCPVEGCDAKFKRVYDVERHVKSKAHAQ
jgi:hypothetical protein